MIIYSLIEHEVMGPNLTAVENMILGTAAFTIAGPVIVYDVSASVAQYDFSYTFRVHMHLCGVKVKLSTTPDGYQFRSEEAQDFYRGSGRTAGGRLAQ